MKKKLLTISTLLVLMVMSLFSCEANGNLVASAKLVFEQWAQTSNVPYRNENYEIISNDGTYAEIFVTVELRPTAQANWTPMETNIECRNVGGSWSCNPSIDISLSRSLIAGTQTAHAATLTTWHNQDQATSTARAFSATSTRQAEESLFNSIHVPDNIDSIEYTYTLHDCTVWHVYDCKYIDIRRITFTILNNDINKHQIELLLVIDDKSINMDSVYEEYHNQFTWGGEVEPGQYQITFDFGNPNINSLVVFGCGSACIPVESEAVFVTSHITLEYVDDIRINK